MTAKRSGTGGRAPAVRSAVTNGARFYLGRGGDLSTIGRRTRDVYDALCQDRGGDAHISEAKRQLARRMATLAGIAEQMESARAEGKTFDVESYIATARTFAYLAARFGLSRKPRDVTPSLDEYIAQRSREDESA